MGRNNPLPRERALRALPNALSLLRLALAVPIAVLILTGAHAAAVIALALFAAGALTDMIDGLIARAMLAQTVLGSHLDPLADKALVLFPLAALAIEGRLSPLALGAFLVLLVREVVVGALRIIRLRMNMAAPSNSIGKIKTALQFAAVGSLIASSAFPGTQWLSPFGTGTLAAATLFSLAGLRRFLPRKLNAKPRRP